MYIISKGVKVILYFLIVIQYACTTTPFKDGIESSFKNHFPDYSENYNIGLRSYLIYDKNINHIGARHILFVNDSQLYLTEYIDSLKDISVLSFNYYDSCLLLIPCRVYENVTIGKPKLTSCKSNDFIPVPNFKRIIDYLEITEEEFYMKYQFYLLKMESGLFLSDDRLLKEIGLPDRWDNGYTKGFGISKDENELIFWVDIW